MIPPTLFEVRQDMLERQLQHFEENTDEPAEIGVTKNQRFAEPAQQVRNKKFVVYSTLLFINHLVKACYTTSFYKLTITFLYWDSGFSGVNTLQSSAYDRSGRGMPSAGSIKLNRRRASSAVYKSKKKKKLARINKRKFDI